MPLAAQLCVVPPLVAFLIIAGLLVTFGWVAILVQRSWLPRPRLEPVHWTASILYNNMAVLYAVLLALITIGVWDQYKQAKQVAEVEAASMLGIARIVKFYPHPSPKVTALKQATLAYAQSVVRDEYPAMGRLQRSPVTVEAFHRVWATASDLEPGSSQESNLQQAILNLLEDVQRNRVARLLASSKGLPGILWAVIAACSAIMLGFTAMFDLASFRIQFAMTSALAVTASLVIFAVVTLNYPFVGSISVAPDGWVFVIRHLL